MESGVEKKHKLTKRRAINKQIVDEGESCDEVNESVRLGKDKTRTKPRRRKNNANLFDEDIIDGFAIISFKSFEDLEVSYLETYQDLCHVILLEHV
ncbi:hypothetical protein FSP39_002427 [Pinctada imbricata]|uniref:Uncharacterized protein n=1 Tax=Pinctada imbricata TaxID=66713 RepID=A0AA89BKD1_PINIB|nr:hypothetical protein FSP39_002427 [Pinctada imbricata]